VYFVITKYTSQGNWSPLFSPFLKPFHLVLYVFSYFPISLFYPLPPFPHFPPLWICPYQKVLLIVTG